MGKIKTNVLGFPRIGQKRELKKAVEAFWAGKATENELLATASQIKKYNWERMRQAGVDLIPSGDFSLYDHVLDLSLALGVVPGRYGNLKGNRLDLYFAMAHGKQGGGDDVIAMEMTKWFDTNYHYIVPEFVPDQNFELYINKPLEDFLEAKALGIVTKPVLVGPVTFLLLGKQEHHHNGEKHAEQHGCSCGHSHGQGSIREENLRLLPALLPAYVELLKSLQRAGAEWVQIDEPYLALDINKEVAEAYRTAYETIARETGLKVILTTYFESMEQNLELAVSLPAAALHVDLVYGGGSGVLGKVLAALPDGKSLSLGVVDGRNIWKNDVAQSVDTVKRAVAEIGEDRVMVSTSCSLLHVPCDLALENNEQTLPAQVKRWMAFGWQKVEETVAVAALAGGSCAGEYLSLLQSGTADLAARKTSELIHTPAVKNRIAALTPDAENRRSAYAERAVAQRRKLNLPLFPTTTIGSFPQTREVRQWRQRHKKGELNDAEYNSLLRGAIKDCVEWQDKAGLDVLVHGEFERNDMVEYFGEQLSGFAFTQNGWVQSYGSRCVKPPVIYGDVSRPHTMTADWITYAQSQTRKPVKGMLTGPVTILKWSFVRNDQPLADTCLQIALAIRDEVADLERAGIGVIQIDEPAIREALPLKRALWGNYLEWAVRCFRVSASGVKDETQIHTHMCYSEFNDIIESIAQMDADVITIECSRSQMELLDAFVEFEYPNEIGPGVYDIHSARVPSVDEMVTLLGKAKSLIPARRLWVNPDCGLKTRGWEETKQALVNMVEAARLLRDGEKNGRKAANADKTTV